MCSSFLYKEYNNVVIFCDMYSIKLHICFFQNKLINSLSSYIDSVTSFPLSEITCKYCWLFFESVLQKSFFSASLIYQLLGISNLKISFSTYRNLFFNFYYMLWNIDMDSKICIRINCKPFLFMIHVGTRALIIIAIKSVLYISKSLYPW